MILSLLFSVFVFAADMQRDCLATNPALQRFFSEYVDAYAKADKKNLKALVTPAFWKEFSGFTPARPGRSFGAKLLRAVAKPDFCFVEWASVERGKKEADPAWFRLVLSGSRWRIDGMPGEGPSE